MTIPFAKRVCFGYLMFLEKEFPEEIVPSDEYSICLKQAKYNTDKAHELMSKRMYHRGELKKLYDRMTDALVDWGLGRFAQFTKTTNEEIYLDSYKTCEYIFDNHLRDDVD